MIWNRIMHLDTENTEHRPDNECELDERPNSDHLRIHRPSHIHPFGELHILAEYSYNATTTIRTTDRRGNRTRSHHEKMENSDTRTENALQNEFRPTRYTRRWRSDWQYLPSQTARVPKKVQEKSPNRSHMGDPAMKMEIGAIAYTTFHLLSRRWNQRSGFLSYFIFDYLRYFISDSMFALASDQWKCWDTF